MTNAIEITGKQGRALFNLMHEPASGPHRDTVGPRHNPTTRTRAHAVPGSALHNFLKGSNWLETGTVLVCHGAQCSDEFRIEVRLGQVTISHIPVG